MSNFEYLKKYKDEMDAEDQQRKKWEGISYPNTNPVSNTYPNTNSVTEDISWGVLFIWSLLLGTAGAFIYLAYYGYKRNKITFRDVIRTLIVGVPIGLIEWIIYCAIVLSHNGT
jgi:hypothetical protein